MAKARRARSTAVVRAVPSRAPAPVIRIAAPRAPTTHKKKVHRRAKGGFMGAKTMIGTAIGGAVLGFAEKRWTTLPTVPVLGRAGTIALAAYFLSKRGGTFSGVLRDVALAGAAVAGYEMGKEGKIAGDDVQGDIPEQVRGIAAQV